eukprot:13564098-Alexandrium_andersonii.AAC.1
MRVISRRCAKLGLTRPSERTAVLLVGIVELARHSGPLHTLQLDPRNVLGMVRDLKCLIKSERKFALQA